MTDEEGDEPTYDLTTPKRFTWALAGAIAMDLASEVMRDAASALDQFRCGFVAHQRWSDQISETVREIESLTTAEAFK